VRRVEHLTGRGQPLVDKAKEVALSLSVQGEPWLVKQDDNIADARLKLAERRKKREEPAVGRSLLQAKCHRGCGGEWLQH
jgi:hypothetical protein